MDRKFDDQPGKRERVPLLTGIMGPSGSGKTYSALRLAKGIQMVTGGDIFVIDTEARRALHYADLFKFRHIDFGAPFGSLDYRDCIQHCVAKGGKVIVTDSMSHEHENVGGYLQTQEAEMVRLAGDDYAKRERVKFAAWIKPAGLRRQMINSIVQTNANLIFCFRAKEKIKPRPGQQPLELGFMPIAGEELLFEMTINFLLLPKSDGVPTWRSDHVGERLMMKLPMQFRGLFNEQRTLDEGVGEYLANWAAGTIRAESGGVLTDSTTSPPNEPACSSQPPPKPREEPAGDHSEPTDELMKWDALLTNAAAEGSAALRQQWANVPKHLQAGLEAAKNRRHKPNAAKVDKAKETVTNDG